MYEKRKNKEHGIVYNNFWKVDRSGKYILKWINLKPESCSLQIVSMKIVKTNGWKEVRKGTIHKDWWSIQRLAVKMDWMSEWKN